MIDLNGPRFGAFRGSVRFVANSADVTAVGGARVARLASRTSGAVTGRPRAAALF